MIKTLTFSLLLCLLVGCIPKRGGYESYYGVGATGQSEDISALEAWFRDFEVKTPISNPSEATNMNDFFAQANSSLQTIFGNPLSNSFLDNGINQIFLFFRSDLLSGKTVSFRTETMNVKSHKNLQMQDIPISSTIVPGTILVIEIQALVDGVSSNFFQNMYFLKLDSNQNEAHYVWYGNQNQNRP